MMSTYTSAECRSCHVEFNSLQGQRDHLKSDWHRCNTMRKLSGLPSLPKEVYSKRVEQSKTQLVQNSVALSTATSTTTMTGHHGVSATGTPVTLPITSTTGVPNSIMQMTTSTGPSQPQPISQQPQPQQQTQQQSTPQASTDEPKFIPGKVAVCIHCGILSEDLNRCQRCKTRLPNSVRTLPAASAATNKTVNMGVGRGNVSANPLTKQKTLPYLRVSLARGELTIDGVKPPPLNAVPPVPGMSTVIPSMNMARPTQPVSGTVRMVTPSNIRPPNTMTTPTRVVTTGGMQGVRNMPGGKTVVTTVRQQGPSGTSQTQSSSFSQSTPSQINKNPTPIPKFVSIKDKDRSKEKYNFGGGADDDINDVAAMGGVNLEKEEQRILDSTGFVGMQIRSCKDENFLFSGPLQQRIRQMYTTVADRNMKNGQITAAIQGIRDNENLMECQISDKDSKVNSEILLKNCQEYEWDEVSHLLKHSADYDKKVLTKALMIARSDSQWNIIKEILMCDVFDKDLILFVFNEAVLENQHNLIAHLGVLYDVDIFPHVLAFCEGKGNWEMIMNILNISLDIDVSVLNKVLISASYHQQLNIVNKVMQSDVEFCDKAIEIVLDLANFNGKLDLIEDLIMLYSHIISDKVLLQATIHQKWEFIFIVLKCKREFRKETLAEVYREAFINMDKDIMQYYFTQNDNGELMDIDTLTAVYGKICFNEPELAKKVAYLLDSKVKSIINPFKMTTTHNPLGSFWSHNLDGNIQVSEICKHSVTDYCRLERSGCPRLHATENYHWQISFTGNYWINLTINQSQCIEEAFCNPCIDHYYPFSNFQFSILSMQEKGIVSLLRHENWVVDFKYNLITNHLTRGNKCDIKHVKNIFIRRLEVKDSDADQYQWYFKEKNDIWVKTNKMEQTNKTTGMKRLVKRRPNRHLILSSCHLNKIVKPDRLNLRVRVDIPIGEYKDIFDKLNHTIKREGIFGSGIESVEKINNTYLKRAFKLRLGMIERQNTDVSKIYVKKLWHGTKKEFVENIIHENFDWRLYGKSNGKVFGQGVYFTPEPKYAIDYAPPDCDGKRYLIISSIIVGFITVGHKNMEKPPLNPLTNIPYDTSVNNLISPSIYVKYNKQEYCPEYVVTIRYKKMSK